MGIGKLFRKVLNKKLFSQVDYSLLITFIGFFIFVGNISTMDVVKNFMEGILNSPKSTFLASVLSSQVISNVPAALFLSGFTKNYSDIIIGVNLGGLGTLIASMASLISYKFYASIENSNSKKYLIVFTILNCIFLTILYVFHIFINI